MALVALAQAVATAWFGPRRPYWIESWPLAALTISLGMVKAETLSGPLSSSRWCWIFDLAQAADAGAEDHAAAAGVFLGEVDARVAHGVDAGDQGELHEAVEPLDVLGVDVAVGRPVVDLAAEADADSPSTSKRSSGRDAALAVADASPEFVHLAAERGDGANARDDDAAFHANPSGRGGFGAFDGLRDVVDGLSDRLDLLGHVVGDVDVELFFEFHHQLDRIQRVGAQIVDERSLAGDLVFADAKLLGNDVNNTFFELRPP